MDVFRHSVIGRIYYISVLLSRRRYGGRISFPQVRYLTFITLSLPFVCKEAKHPPISVCPGAPHATSKEDVYMGYHIPKGALVMPILWCVSQSTEYIQSKNNASLRQMAHDPEIYSEPFKFKPERFLGVDGRKPELDPRAIAFGFGRRSVKYLRPNFAYGDIN